MNRYWTRISLGALLVFGLGMTGILAVRRGEAKVKNFLSTAGTRIPLQLANLQFRLDGRSLGRLTGIDVSRSGAGEPGIINLSVALADLAAIETLKACSLTADRIDRLNDRSTFRCADPAEIAGGALVEVGEVAFENGRLVRPFFLPRHTVDRWRRSDVRTLDAKLAADGQGGVQARGNFDVNNDGSPQRGSFSLKADSNGAVVSVRDAAGKALLDFRADHNGVNLNLRDKQGRSLVKLLTAGQ